MAVWPPSLPACPVNRTFVWQPVANIVETPNDVGDVISRRRFTGTSIIESGTLLLTRDQTLILFEFWSVSCAQGSLEFVMKSWRDGVLRDYKFVGDAPPQFVQTGPRWTTSLTLRYTVA